MGKGYRQGRLGEEIRKIISEMLLRELKDPRLHEGMVSITDVEASQDGSVATVYLSVFTGQEKDRAEKEQEVLEAMQSCKGIFKREIGQKIKLRRVPELRFCLDESMEYGQHIDALIDEVVNRDEKK